MLEAGGQVAAPAVNQAEQMLARRRLLAGALALLGEHPGAFKIAAPESGHGLCKLRRKIHSRPILARGRRVNGAAPASDVSR